ncbi:MAG: hypothetical protein H7A33_00615 [Deltaproteobacteria bacterium]|nr:hypothetical protein [Deltaproteobacteria bacterium]
MMLQSGFSKILQRVLFIFLIFSLVHCTPKKIASDITAQIMASGAPSFEMESDIEIARTSGLTMVKMIEAFQYDNPKNKNLNVLLARSYANFGQGFWEYDILQYKNTNEQEYQKAIERAKNFYKRGKDYGLKALRTNGSFNKALESDLDSFNKALKGMGRSYVPALFWTAMNWGSYINLNKDSPLAIAAFPKVEAMMARVLELDEFYYYGGPHLFFGVSYGSRPKIFGGDQQKSKEHFEKAIAAYERKFLLGIVYYAQIYAVQYADPGLFDSLLNEVLSADPSALPEARLGNELAQKRARWLLDHRAQFFDLSE